MKYFWELLGIESEIYMSLFTVNLPSSIDSTCVTVKFRVQGVWYVTTSLSPSHFAWTA